MTAFRILDQSPVFFDLQGVIADGGSLQFYTAGTTTPKDVYGDQALTVNNGPTIAIGSDGRAVDDIWGDGSYRVRVYAADATLISDDDNVEIPGGTGQVIPTLADGQFLSALGGVLVAADIEQAPDPTGQSGKILGSDGTSLVWADMPAAGADGANADITLTGTSAKIGTGTGDKFFIQTGTGTAPASGTSGTQVDATFPVAFKSILLVAASITSGSYSSVGFYASSAVLNKSVTGFTFAAQVSAHQGGSGSDANIISSVPFDWVAFGTIAA